MESLSSLLLIYFPTSGAHSGNTVIDDVAAIDTAKYM